MGELQCLLPLDFKRVFPLIIWEWRKWYGTRDKGGQKESCSINSSLKCLNFKFSWLFLNQYYYLVQYFFPHNFLWKRILWLNNCLEKEVTDFESAWHRSKYKSWLLTSVTRLFIVIHTATGTRNQSIWSQLLSSYPLPAYLSSRKPIVCQQKSGCALWTCHQVRIRNDH